jgi:diguanylate cyclase (GGDEF)-like protein/putative nucleotidyltransferase with HDIG domain
MNSAAATLFSSLICGLGLIALAMGFLTFEPSDVWRLAAYFVITMLAATIRDGENWHLGLSPVGFLFAAIGMVELTLGETMLLACSAILVQCIRRTRKLGESSRTFFNVSLTAIAVSAGHLVFESLQFLPDLFLLLRLLIAATVCYCFSTFGAMAVEALLNGTNLKLIWKEQHMLSLNYYLVAIAGAGFYHYLEGLLNGTWQLAIFSLPVVWLIYRVYTMQMGRMEEQTRHSDEMASLHLRTIEALALAIEAKDTTTHEHLQRVQVYALEIGRELGMNTKELEALQAAAILHDIGKLAVPEHIISKPGKLTPEEFDKMKIHPVVGAEIIERVKFPYEVAPIVRAHHEKWDGTGYPSGTKAENIPLGARILTAVDCLDALASDRQYRRALPLDEAMGVLEKEAGKAFDPQVVEILRRRYVELEAKARKRIAEVDPARLSTDIHIIRGDAPDAGFENSDGALVPAGTDSIDFLGSIAAARQEVQTLFEIQQDLGNSLSLDETLSLLAVRLRKIIPYEALAVYQRKEDILSPAYVVGENYRLFNSLRIPMGQGLSGWVAENQKPILNGNPSVEPGYLNDPNMFSTLRSTLAVPLQGLTGVVGVMALYRSERDAFTRDHLRLLLAVSAKVAMAMDNALKFRQAENSATTDFLTDLPNARSLFLHLDSELSRTRRQLDSLAVLVCDLDGFKQVNDRFGHLEGNKLIRQVALKLKEMCREYDYVARMGGDEFVLVLPGLRPADIEIKVQRLEALVRETGKVITGDDCVGISIGSAHFPEDGDDAESLLAEADRRMYKVKQNNKLTAPVRGLKSKDFSWRAMGNRETRQLAGD